MYPSSPLRAGDLQFPLFIEGSVLKYKIRRCSLTLMLPVVWLAFVCLRTNSTVSFISTLLQEAARGLEYIPLGIHDRDGKVFFFYPEKILLCESVYIGQRLKKIIVTWHIFLMIDVLHIIAECFYSSILKNQRISHCGCSSFLGFPSNQGIQGIYPWAWYLSDNWLELSSCIYWVCLLRLLNSPNILQQNSLPNTSQESSEHLVPTFSCCHHFFHVPSFFWINVLQCCDVLEHWRICTCQL